MAPQRAWHWSRKFVASRLGLREFSGFCAETGGGVAVIFGLSATVLVGLVGGATDYARILAKRNLLQSAVDDGVLAGGNALKLVASNTASIVGLTTQTIRSKAVADADAPITITVSVASDKTSVSARAEQDVKLLFAPFVGIANAKIAAVGKASVVGKMRLCMLALDPAAPGAFNLEKKAQVTANECTLYSDSANGAGMVGRDSALARAQTICSVGGFKNDRANFTPYPQTGCPKIEDPLKDRTAPPIGDCTPIPSSANSKGDVSKNEIDTSTELDPSTYCGLTIKKNAVVTLKPGIYVIKNRPLLVKDKATMTGTDVAFYFTGEKTGLLFDKDTTVSLAAPTTGVMAGLLMSEQRAVSDPVDPVIGVTDEISGLSIPPTPPPLGATKPMRTYRIISNNTRTMLGTIYLPAGRLVIDAEKPVADQSAYTVVVAQQINLYEGPNLYLNANYGGTSVPVPKGVGPVSGQLLLTQ